MLQRLPPRLSPALSPKAPWLPQREHAPSTAAESLPPCRFVARGCPRALICPALSSAPRHPTTHHIRSRYARSPARHTMAPGLSQDVPSPYRLAASGHVEGRQHYASSPSSPSATVIPCVGQCGCGTRERARRKPGGPARRQRLPSSPAPPLPPWQRQQVRPEACPAIGAPNRIGSFRRGTGVAQARCVGGGRESVVPLGTGRSRRPMFCRAAGLTLSSLSGPRAFGNGAALQAPARESAALLATQPESRASSLVASPLAPLLGY